ncbi:hypothetical protein [Kitasatospora sp. NPDC008115]|uniref:hypothetical protein n=1 Tax=Kitasatospora sp. NPDC008115 TaxID=3364022 RepID=UPI0036E4D389
MSYTGGTPVPKPKPTPTPTPNPKVAGFVWRFFNPQQRDSLPTVAAAVLVAAAGAAGADRLAQQLAAPFWVELAAAELAAVLALVLVFATPAPDAEGGVR